MTVNPAVLAWARETAQLDVSTAAARVGVSPDRIAEWERGDTDPTINQLRAIADAYHRPLAALFMPAPLTDERLPRLPDFRRSDTRDTPNPRALVKAIMRAHRQRDALVQIGSELGLTDAAMSTAISLPRHAPTEEAGGVLRAALAIDDMPKQLVGRPQDFLRLLVRVVEALNVTVIQVQRVDVGVMRGFSLGDGPYPIAAVNGGDWPRGKAFTLLHELAHIGFRSNGLCDLEREDGTDIERRCDGVAAAALMPRVVFLNTLQGLRGREVTAERARELGRPFGASGQSALLRMVELGRASWDDYWRLKPAFDDAFRHFKADEKAANEATDAPIFYQLKARDLGHRFIAQVLHAYGEEAISARDVVQLLEVSYDKLPKLARAARSDVQ